MPVDLLQELETPAPVAQTLNEMEGHLRETIKGIAHAVGEMRGVAGRFEEFWRQVVSAVAEGRTAEMQALRSQFLRSFEERLGLLEQTHARAQGLRGLGEENVPDPDILLPDIAGMERLRAKVLDPWQTADDLEELAARDYPLSTADLDRIGPHCKPPASWYAEEGKPF